MNNQTIKLKRNKLLNEIKIGAEKQGISQQEIAEKENLPQGNVSRYLSGNHSPKLDIVLRLADAANLEIILRKKSTLNERKARYRSIKLGNGKRQIECGRCFQRFNKTGEYVGHECLPK